MRVCTLTPSSERILPSCSAISHREKFVELHSLPLMDYLIDDIQTNLTEEEKATLVKNKQIIPNPPTMGELDLELVNKSTYFFS